MANDFKRSAGIERQSNDEVKRRGQVEAVVKLLRDRIGQWVPLPLVIEAGGCQYSARIHFARHTLNLKIENKRESGGHSYFRLLPSQPLPRREDAAKKEVAGESGLLFPAEPLSYRDPEEFSR
jgi:hypothetical protein